MQNDEIKNEEDRELLNDITRDIVEEKVWTSRVQQARFIKSLLTMIYNKGYNRCVSDIEPQVEDIINNKLSKLDKGVHDLVDASKKSCEITEEAVSIAKDRNDTVQVLKSRIKLMSYCLCVCLACVLALLLVIVI